MAESAGSALSAETLFESVGFKAHGPVGWHDMSLPDSPGVYVITVPDASVVRVGQPAKGAASDAQLDAARGRWKGE